MDSSVIFGVVFINAIVGFLLRLFHLRGLQVDESALTGESVPVHKHPDALALEMILADRKNLAFAGTFVIADRPKASCEDDHGRPCRDRASHRATSRSRRNS